MMTQLNATCFFRLSKTNLSLFLCLVSLICNAQKLIFSHYGLPEGLPQETVLCMTTDQFGMLWMGTSDGIVRYDGSDFFVPPADIDTGDDISGYRIGSLNTFKQFILAGTGQKGVIAYDVISQKTITLGRQDANCTAIEVLANGFLAAYYDGSISYFNEDLQEFALEIPDASIKQIGEIQYYNDELYVGTNSGTLYKATWQPEETSTLSLKQINLPSRWIYALETIDNVLYVGTFEGLWKIDNASSNAQKVDIEFCKEDGLTPAIITLTHANNTLYIGTQFGLYEWPLDQCAYRYTSAEKNNPKHLNAAVINDLHIIDDVLFIGHITLDISEINKPKVFLKPTDSLELDNPSVFAILEHNDLLLIGTSSGLVISDKKHPEHSKLYSNFRIRGMTNDKNGNVWFVTAAGTYVIPNTALKIEDAEFITVPYDINDPIGLTSNIGRNMYRDNKGDIWVVTFRNGLCKFVGNVEKGDFKFKRYAFGEEADNLPSTFLLSMVQDQKENYWISTQKGLSKMRLDASGNPTYKNYSEADGLITSGVLSGFVTKDGTVWIASRKGLNKYITDEDRFVSYGKKHGLSNTFVYNVIEDDTKDLWLTTNGGIFKFNSKTERFINYIPKDGLQSTEFNLGALHKSVDTNLIYAGGIAGLNAFYPDKIGLLDQPSELRFTQIQSKGIPLQAHKDSILTRSIDTTNDLVLRYNDFPIDLKFSAVDYRPSKNIQYQYRLPQQGQQWNDLNQENKLQLLNLSPKAYTLEVRGLSRGIPWEQPPTKLAIDVLPPWYRSNLAFLLYGLLLTGSIYTYYRINLNQKMAAQEAKRLQDLDDLKSRFITNITHEFRTPLTIILGYIDRLKEKNIGNKQLTDNLETVKKNSNNLLSLVNQMLDLAKLEQGRLQFNWVNTDVFSFIKNNVSSFKSIASEKEISILFSSNVDTFYTDTDIEKLRQILTNLIGNAIKFSPENSAISVQLNVEDVQWSLTIKDEGYGIDQESLPNIFERFYQVNNNDATTAQGTGIGLALTKELTELLNGSIAVNSQVNVGTTFILKFNKQQEAERIESHGLSDNPSIGKTHVMPLISNFENISDYNVLLVEDNKDMASYIASCIQDQFNITFAENGKIGLDKATSLLPDIIITDVMMPIMDGLEFTSLVQQQEVTNHIPVIMLTSKAMQEDKMSGLSSGADAYLTKPFDKDELLLRMQSLIAKREILRQKYQSSLVETEKQALPSKQDVFVNKAIEIIDKNIDVSEFNSAMLASNLAMSESQLYRKLKAITNKSTALFIRQIRLERAKLMLETNNLTVSEVAYAVGFNDPKWFSKTFKEAFGISPSSLIK